MSLSSPFEERIKERLQFSLLLRRDVPPKAGQRGCCMKRIIPEPFLTYAQNQRKNKNPWEAKLWQHLRARKFYGLKFKRQVQIGKYLYDFSCREKMILIELDGGQHSELAVVVRDEHKEKYAEKESYRILRFQNIEIDKNLEGVLESIKQKCKL